MNRIELHTDTYCSEELSLIAPYAVVKQCLTNNCAAVAITDKNSVYSYIEAEDFVQGKPLKLIYGITLSCLDNDDRYDVVLLAKNLEGRDHIFRLVELIHQEQHSYGKCVTREQLETHRGGLLLGSNARNGQLIRAIQHRKSNAYLDSILQGYDYVEFLEEPYDLAIEVYEAAKRNQIPVCAVQYANIASPVELEACHVLGAVNQFRKGTEHPAYMKDGETLEQSYRESYILPNEEQMIQEVLYANPDKILSQIETIPTISGLLKQASENCDHQNLMDQLRWKVYEGLREKFGDRYPTEFQDRAEEELRLIEARGAEVVFLAAANFSEKMCEQNAKWKLSGVNGGWFLFYLLGVSEFNPYSRYMNHCGCLTEELPDEWSPFIGCPVCHTITKTEGHNIPRPWLEPGSSCLNGNLELHSSIPAGAIFHNEVILEGANIIEFGGISPDDADDLLTNSAAEQYIQGQNNPAELAELLNNGYFMWQLKSNLLPRVRSTIIRYHLNFDSTILEHLPVVKRPSEIVSCYQCMLPWSYPGNVPYLLPSESKGLKTLEKCEKAIGEQKKEIFLEDSVLFERIQFLAQESYMGEYPLSEIACSMFGIPVGIHGKTDEEVLDRQTVNAMARMMAPESARDLARLFCLIHSSGVWNDNAETLLGSGSLTPKQVITCREDVYDYLIQKGASEEDAAQIMSYVRKGRAARKGFTEEHKIIFEKCHAEEWFIACCQKIEYLFPFAHGYMMAVDLLRMLWLGLYCPEETERVLRNDKDIDKDTRYDDIWQMYKKCLER